MVIPVLVHEATMPIEDELPESLVLFARRHALSIVDSHFEEGSRTLIQAIESGLQEAPAAVLKRLAKEQFQPRDDRFAQMAADLEQDEAARWVVQAARPGELLVKTVVVITDQRLVWRSMEVLGENMGPLQTMNVASITGIENDTGRFTGTLRVHSGNRTEVFRRISPRKHSAKVADFLLERTRAVR